MEQCSPSFLSERVPVEVQVEEDSVPEQGRGETHGSSLAQAVVGQVQVNQRLVRLQGLGQSHFGSACSLRRSTLPKAVPRHVKMRQSGVDREGGAYADP